jgi:hypothetical protein
MSHRGIGAVGGSRPVNWTHERSFPVVTTAIIRKNASGTLRMRLTEMRREGDFCGATHQTNKGEQ